MRKIIDLVNLINVSSDYIFHDVENYSKVTRFRIISH